MQSWSFKKTIIFGFIPITKFNIYEEEIVNSNKTTVTKKLY
jgi:hypothetical protein